MADTLVLKYVILGQEGVGKSAFTMVVCGDTPPWNSYISTIGVDFRVTLLSDVNGRNVKIQVWDTAGQERFRNIANSYLRGMHAYFILIDTSDVNMTKDKAQEYIRFYLKLVVDYSGKNFPKDLTVIVIGNTRGKPAAPYFRQVAEAEKLIYHEMDIKDSAAVSRMFSGITREVVIKYENEVPIGRMAMSVPPKKKSRFCTLI
jgi:GTPase SAR1 family protein